MGIFKSKANLEFWYTCVVFATGCKDDIKIKMVKTWYNNFLDLSLQKQSALLVLVWAYTKKEKMKHAQFIYNLYTIDRVTLAAVKFAVSDKKYKYNVKITVKFV